MTAVVIVLAVATAGAGYGGLWSLLIGTVLPALTALVTKEHATDRVKALLTALLSGVTGAVSGFLITPPQGMAQWEQVIGSIAVTWVTAFVTYAAGWKHTPVIAAIARWTRHFGFGGHPPPPPPAA